MSIKTILVDDEILNLKNLEIILKQHFQEIEVIGLFQSTAEAIKFINQNQIDLIFLDISMPISDGFDLVDHFPERNFKIIFVTAHEEYALKAIKINAFDYILKPIILEELQTAVKNILKDFNKSNHTNKITLSYEGGKSIIDCKEIIYLKGFDNLTSVYLTQNRKITISKTLKHFEETLERHFFRIHKSYMINLNFVNKIVSKETYFIELNEGTILPISRRNYKNLNQILKK